MNSPILFIFSGLPASGKSTLAKLLACHTRAMYIRVDTFELGLSELCRVDVDTQGYELSYRVVEDNLKLGISCVADSCNSVKISRDEWEKLALDSGASYKNIQIECADTIEHKARLVRRNEESDGHSKLTWEQIENRLYEPWDKEVLTIQTAGKTINECFSELCKKLGLTTAAYKLSGLTTKL